MAEIVPGVDTAFYVTDDNGDRYKVTLVAWHCCHGMSTRDEHRKHCKTKHGANGILGPLYRIDAI